MDIYSYRFLLRNCCWLDNQVFPTWNNRRGLTGDGVDTTEVWNAFLQSPGQVIFFQFLVICLTLAAIWKGAKAIEKVNVVLMISLFVLLFMSLFLSLWMDFEDGTLDGATFMFSVDFDLLFEPEIWINALSQSAWSCSAGMGVAITYAVYMRKDEDTVLNAFTMGLANNSISIIAGLAVLSSIFAVSSDPLATVTGGSSAIFPCPAWKFSLKHREAQSDHSL